MAMIDGFCHILPKKYLDALKKMAPPGFAYTEIMEGPSALWNLDARFRIMDKYDKLTQVLIFSLPPVEAVANPQKAAELARRGNEELAEIVAKYPDYFAAGVAGLPMNNVDASLAEIDKAIRDLGLKGVLLYTNINGKPLDSPEFMPIYQKMAQYDLPIWLHPRREETVADYSTESQSKYHMFSAFGWPYETELAMSRLVCSGVLEKYPNLKFITHHCGGGVPFLAGRIGRGFRSRGDPKRDAFLAELSKPPIEYFHMFYGDTAINGYTPALMCGHAFFGTEHVLFGTDMPLGGELGHEFVRETIRAVRELSVAESDKKKIFEDNARRLLHLGKGP